MTVILILIGIAVALFIGAFWSRRRFGLLGLALTAGATLSAIWGHNAGLVVASTGLVPAGPITNAVALSVVVLLPSIVLLFHGYTYKDDIPRVIGAALFTILAIAFLIEPISYALPLEGIAADAYRQVIMYRDVIISIGVVLAIVDLFFTKPAKEKRR